MGGKPYYFDKVYCSICGRFYTKEEARDKNGRYMCPNKEYPHRCRQLRVIPRKMRDRRKYRNE